MGMTEKLPHLKVVASETSSDATATTTVDATRIAADENQEAPQSDPDPLAFDPGKFSRIVIPMALRKEMSQAKPPRLGPEFFLDTVPPNRALTAPAATEETETVVAVAKRRPLVAVVVLCLFGALFVLALALFRSIFGASELPTAQTRTSTGAAEISAVPARIEPSATTAALAPPPPPISSAAQLATSDELDQPPRVPARVHAKAPAISKPGHPALTSTPQDTPAPPVTAAEPTTPTAVPSTPAPARTSWFHK